MNKSLSGLDGEISLRVIAGRPKTAHGPTAAKNASDRKTPPRNLNFGIYLRLRDAGPTLIVRDTRASKTGRRRILRPSQPGAYPRLPFPAWGDGAWLPDGPRFPVERLALALCARILPAILVVPESPQRQHRPGYRHWRSYRRLSCCGSHSGTRRPTCGFCVHLIACPPRRNRTAPRSAAYYETTRWRSRGYAPALPARMSTLTMLQSFTHLYDPNRC